MIESGRHTYGLNNIELFGTYESDKIIIGNFCSIARDLKILLNSDHRTDWVTTYPFGNVSPTPFTLFTGEGHPKSNGDVVIGNDVWVGAFVTIRSGVTIGDGAVIATNSHVVKNVEPYSIVGGNPAKHIKYRFNKDTIEKLLEISWWNWDDERIDRNSLLLCQPDIEKFIREYE